MKTYKGKTKNDRLKYCQELAKKSGGICIKNIIIKFCNYYNIDIVNNFYIDISQVYKSKNYKKTREIINVAKKRGGLLLSQFYLNSSTKLKFKCSKGHEWETLATNVLKGHWCAICSNAKRVL